MALLALAAVPAPGIPTPECVDKGLGFRAGSLRNFGIPTGLETCNNVIPILTMADPAANFTLYQVCTWNAKALSMALAGKGLPWQPPTGPEFVYEICESYCSATVKVETPCRGARLRLQEAPITELGFTQLRGDGSSKACKTCSRGGQIIPPGAPVCCDFAQYTTADYAVQKDFKRGVRTRSDCAQRCLETDGCTGIHTTGTPNFCALWLNHACSRLDSPGVMSNGSAAPPARTTLEIGAPRRICEPEGLPVTPARSYCHAWHREPASGAHAPAKTGDGAAGGALLAAE
jgi:hypothetical protein